MPHIRIHNYRHLHASVLANNSINIQDVTRRLGHAYVQMTWNIYSHLYPQESQRAVNVLERVHINARLSADFPYNFVENS